MSGFEGMGYRIGGKALYVGDLPGRKQTCLYVQDGSTIRTLAFFKTEKQAGEALEMIERIASAKAVMGYEA